MVCTWLRKKSSCSCLPVLPSPALPGYCLTRFTDLFRVVWEYGCISTYLIPSLFMVIISKYIDDQKLCALPCQRQLKREITQPRFAFFHNACISGCWLRSWSCTVFKMRLHCCFHEKRATETFNVSACYWRQYNYAARALLMECCCGCMNHIQSDTSGCSEPPVGVDLKVAL